jgi:hypothetical protein
MPGGANLIPETGTITPPDESPVRVLQKKIDAGLVYLHA